VDVYLEVTQLACGKVAEATFVRFVAGVDMIVPFEGGLREHLPIAYGTKEASIRLAEMVLQFQRFKEWHIRSLEGLGRCIS